MGGKTMVAPRTAEGCATQSYIIGGASNQPRHPGAGEQEIIRAPLYNYSYCSELTN